MTDGRTRGKADYRVLLTHCKVRGRNQDPKELSLITSKAATIKNTKKKRISLPTAFFAKLWEEENVAFRICTNLE